MWDKMRISEKEGNGNAAMDFYMNLFEVGTCITAIVVTIMMVHSLNLAERSLNEYFKIFVLIVSSGLYATVFYSLVGRLLKKME